jgi:phosphoglycerol transferase
VDRIPVGHGVGACFRVAGKVETGSLYVNRALGAPGVSETFELPSADLLHLLALWLMGLLGAGWATAINVFYLSSYVAVGVAAVFVMRRLGASRVASAAVAVLYALLPYHWMRGDGHLFLASYWIVPPVLLVAMWMDSAATLSGGSGDLRRGGAVRRLLRLLRLLLHRRGGSARRAARA